MPGLTSSSAGLDPRRRRLLYRAWHRGTREMDILVGRFAEAALPGMSETDVAALEVLIEAPDPDLFSWLSDGAPVPPNFDTPVFRALKAFHTHRGPIHS